MSAEPPLRGRYVFEGAPPLDVDPERGIAAVLYLNRCEGGCVVTPGGNDSSADTSSIVAQTVSLSAFAHGDVAWNNLVTCARGVFAPFNIEVTDVEPLTAHHEVMVAGTFDEFGLIDPALGVAPLTCAVTPESLTFVFANVTSDLASVCAATAQEPAHAWGLDHELLCQDPMTYLTGCGAKTAFQDALVDCGELSPRGCACGGAQQNSHAAIVAIFGERDAPGPTVTIARPTDGARVAAGFEIEVTAVDDAAIATVGVTVNGQPAPPLIPGLFASPEGIDDVTAVIVATATNVHGAAGSAQISVAVGAGGSGTTTTTGGVPGAPRDGGCAAASRPPSPLAVFIVLLLGAIVGGWRKARRPSCSAS